MRSATRVRPTSSASGLLLLGALTLLASGGCDDGGSGTGGAEGSSGTTNAGGTTGMSEATTQTTTSTTTGETASGGVTTVDTTDSTTTDATTGSGSGSSTEPATGSSGTDTTGAAAIDVPFTVHDPGGLELTARVPAGWVVITTAAQWASFTDAPVPEGVTFPAQSVLFGSRGAQPYPGHALSVETLSWQGDTLTVTGAQTDPAADCETYAFIWPADTLVSFDALDGEVEDVQDQTAATEASCAAGGGDSMECDLESPCGPGLLCAGIIRSTFFLNDPGGLCLDASYRGTFSGPELAIPADGATAEVAMEVTGLTSVDMDVAIVLDLNHPAPEELVILLRNPDGNEVSVANLQSTPFHPGGVPIVPLGFSGDESVNGTWSLVVRDTVDNANSGSVEGWDLEIMSRFD